jgi:hypothetical protein
MVFAARSALTVQLSLALPLRFQVARSVAVASLPSLSRRWSGGGGGGPSRLRDTIASFLLVGGAAGVAATPLPLATAIGITSAIAASSIIYIVPSLVDLRGVGGGGGGGGRGGLARKCASYLSLVVGGVVLVFGTIFSITGGGAGGG